MGLSMDSHGGGIQGELNRASLEVALPDGIVLRLRPGHFVGGDQACDFPAFDTDFRALAKSKPCHGLRKPPLPGIERGLVVCPGARVVDSLSLLVIL